MSVSILLFALSLLQLCLAEDLTLYLNDVNFVDTGNTAHSSECGGSGWTSSLGDSVSVSFVGTNVTINFIGEDRGAIGQITIDGENVTTVNTYKYGVQDSDCVPLPWASGILSAGNHTISVTQIGPGNSSMTTAGFVWMRSFDYAATSSATTVAPATSSLFTPITSGASSFTSTVTANAQPSGSAIQDPVTLSRLLNCAPCGKSKCSFATNSSSSTVRYSLMAGTPVTNCEQGATASIKSTSGGTISIGETWSAGGSVGFNLGELNIAGTWSVSRSKQISWTQSIEIEVQPGQMGVLTAEVEYQRTGGLMKASSSDTFPIISNQPVRVTSYGAEIVPCNAAFSGNASDPFNCTSPSQSDGLRAQVWLEGVVPWMGILMPMIPVVLLTSVEIIFS